MRHETEVFLKGRMIKTHIIQKGFVLITLMVSLIFAATILFALGRHEKGALVQQQKRVAVLGEAKQALLDYAFAHPTNIGVLPFPDRNADANGFDGDSDCVSNTASISIEHLIGRFPWHKTQTPCNIMPIGLYQASATGGEPLWYAVSRNVVENAGVAVVPNLLNAAPYDWLTLYDKSGIIISDRIAFLLIAPGPALDTQNRISEDATQYLEATFTEQHIEISNFDLDTIFIAGPASATFNDTIKYITIDEMIALLQQRVIAQYRAALETYYTDHHYYPYAALLGDISGQCQAANLNGSIPCDDGNCGIGESLGIDNSAALSSWCSYIYYHVAQDCTAANFSGCDIVSAGDLQINLSHAIDAVLIASGRPLTEVESNSGAQDRSGPIPHALNEYIDLNSNSDGDKQYVTGVYDPITMNDTILALPRSQ